MTAFVDWQPRYAEHNIPTFPVRIDGRDKKPAISHYLAVGLGGSAQLALKFPDIDALGFALGRRSGITVLDVDTPDENLLADALGRHGRTPVVVRSGSGNFHAWYRHHGERRRIRPDPRTPIDILGGGFVIAPPSKGVRGHYEFIQGGLDDLGDLPPLRGIEEPRRDGESSRVGEGRRNSELWRHCMRQVRYCDDLDDLIDAARTHNEREFYPPLEDAEVIKVAASAWKYEQAGENRFGGTFDKADDFIGNQDAFFLLKFLRQHQPADREFCITNTLAGRLHWPIKRLAAARKGLIALGRIEQVRPPRKHQAALYRFKAVPISPFLGGQK